MDQYHSLHITNLSNEHSAWIRGIEFYTDEILRLKTRCTEIIEQMKSAPNHDQLEQYLDQFMTLEKDLYLLKNDILVNFNRIKVDLEMKEMHVGNSTLAETDSLRDRYILLEKTVNELRHAFNRFFCNHMDVVLR